MHKRTKVCSAVLLALGGAAGLTSAPAFAQATLERVEITGSSIRRIDAETALPVQVIKKEQIEKSGATSVTDLLQKLAAVQGSFGESGGVGGTGGIATVSIHNVGDARTLVLLNGHRLTQWGGQLLTGFGAAIDLNSLPISAIERVEILTDGASALYGADAIAGVVNFITRRYTNEGDVTIGLSKPRGGAEEKRISATKGFGNIEQDGFNFMLSVQHDERTKLDAKDRNFGSTGKVFFNYQGQNYRFQQFSASPIPANATDDLGQLINPYQKVNGVCPDKTFRVIEPYNDGSGLVDDYCGFDFVGELEIYPIRKRDTLLTTVNKKVGDQELFLDLLYAKSQQIARIAPVPGSISIPAGTPLHTQYLLPIGITGDSLAFYRIYDLGKRENTDDHKFYDIALGSKGALFGWDYNATYSRSQSDAKTSISGYPGALAVRRLRLSGLLDPFVGPGQQSAAAQAAINAANYSGYWDGGTATLDTVALRGSRELTQLPAGPMMLGSGVSFQKEKFQSKPSLFAQGKLADPVAGTLCDPANGVPCDTRFGDEAFTQPYSANRKAYAVFGELIVPVTKTLEASGSVRYDHYSDFGNSTTAKASFRWNPSKEFLVRGSVGTGFHAPTVPQVNAAIQPFGVTSDNYTCSPEMAQIAASLGAQCQPGNRQYDQLSGGNKDLKPEKSLQGTLGIRFEPNSQLSMGADLWHVAIRDSFGQLTEQEVFANPLQYLSSWTTKIDTGTGVNYLAFYAGNQNLGKSYATGLDLDATGKVNLGFANLTSTGTVTYMIRERSQLQKDGPYYSAIGNHAELGTVTFRWQGKWINTFTHGNWAHTFVVNAKSGYLDAETTVDVLDAAGNVTGTRDLRLPVKRSATLDWQTQWTPIKSLALTVGLLNVFDTKPPLAISTGGVNRGQQFGYDDRYYDSRGRTAYVNASYKF
ncbi:MAG: TonB-dependent receptor [Burkholderiaceae bacterium]|nr:MAG: TonB-dependent receptor [Burkholderiaceae bacterium]